MGSWGLLGWGLGGFAVAAWIVWLTQPQPWLAVILGGASVVAGWVTGIVIIDRMGGHDDLPG